MPSPHRRLATALPLVAALAACGQGTAPDAGPSPDPAIAAGGRPSGPEAPSADARLVMAPGAAVLVTDLADPAQVGPRDPFQLRGARIDGDSLRVTIQTGGGCARHVFRLGVSQHFLESQPVQVRAALGHDAAGDRCRALLGGELAASLRPLAEAYRLAYRTPGGTIDIRLDGWTEPLRYTF